MRAIEEFWIDPSVRWGERELGVAHNSSIKLDPDGLRVVVPARAHVFVAGG